MSGLLIFISSIEDRAIRLAGETIMADKDGVSSWAAFIPWRWNVGGFTKPAEHLLHLKCAEKLSISCRNQENGIKYVLSYAESSTFYAEVLIYFLFILRFFVYNINLSHRSHPCFREEVF